MERVPRERNELEELLRDEIAKLDRSAAVFDGSGPKERRQEARTLAVGVANLVYDQGRTHSLLSQLGILDSLVFEVAGRAYEPANLMSLHSLVALGPDGEYHPAFALGRPKTLRSLRFPAWWSEPVFVVKQSTYDVRTQFTRKNLVLDVRDTDGGAHFDFALPARYAELSRKNALGWQMIDGDPPRTPPVDAGNPVPSGIRQLWFELRQALVASNSSK